MAALAKPDVWNECPIREVNKKDRRVRFNVPGLKRFNDICIPVGNIHKVDIFLNTYLFDTVSENELDTCEILTYKDKKYYSWRSIASDARLRLIVGGLLYHTKKTNPSFVSNGIVSFISELDLEDYGVKLLTVVITYKGTPSQELIYLR